MKKVLIVGSDNACHSQMMAALIKHISFNRIFVESAGIAPKKVNKFVQKILYEIGIDLSQATTRNMNEFIHTPFDIIITTTDEAREKANTLLTGSTRIHREFDDPRKGKLGEIDRLNAFRELREEMNEWLNEFISRHRLV